MKKYLFVALLAAGIFSGCSKSESPDETPNNQGLLIKKTYQPYKYGELDPSSKDWESLKYNYNNQLIEENIRFNYDYDQQINYLYTNKYSYNDDGSLKEKAESGKTTNYVYRYFYENKKLIRYETWKSTGLVDKSTYSYKNNRIDTETNYSTFTEPFYEYKYEYNDKGLLVKKSSRSLKETSPNRYDFYEYDSHGNITLESYQNLKTMDKPSVINKYSYIYDNNGRIKIKERLFGFNTSDGLLIEYEYNNDGTVKKEFVKKKDYNSSYINWMVITYQYLKI